MAEHDEMTWIAEAVLRHRTRRKEDLPEGLFGEHAWEAMLHLFVADSRSQRLDGETLAKLTGCSEGSMSRWIKYLSEQGLLDGDGHGEMKVLLTLSPKGLQAVENRLEDLQALGHDYAIHRNSLDRRQQLNG